MMSAAIKPGRKAPTFVAKAFQAPVTVATTFMASSSMTVKVFSSLMTRIPRTTRARLD
jgi:hypothetical protein